MKIPEKYLIKYSHMSYFDKLVEFDKVYSEIVKEHFDELKKGIPKDNRKFPELINIFISVKIKKGFSGFRKGNRVLILRYWINDWDYEVYGYHQKERKKVSRRVPIKVLYGSVDLMSIKFEYEPNFRYVNDYYNKTPIEASSGLLYPLNPQAESDYNKVRESVKNIDKKYIENEINFWK